MSSVSDILVGVDGSADSTAALVWAAQEAQVSGRGLHVVHVVDYLPGYGYVWASTVGAADALRDTAQPILGEARALLRELAPDVPVRTSSPIGGTTKILLEECELSGLAVMGSRGRGALSRLLLGSVSQRLAAHAPCPVVLVPEDHAATSSRGAARVARVVVGVGDPPANTTVLECGMAVADRHRVPLLAVRTWQQPHAPLSELDDRFAPPAGNAYRTERDRYEKALLHDALGSARSAHPSVHVTARVRSGAPAATLTRLCHPGDLLVIGHQHAGRFYPPALGPAAAQIVHHARCPLMIVPVDITRHQQPQQRLAAAHRS